jgi:heme A synthase
MAQFIIGTILFASLLWALWWCFRPTWVVRFSDSDKEVRFQAYTTKGLRRQIKAHTRKHENYACRTYRG